MRRKVYAYNDVELAVYSQPNPCTCLQQQPNWATRLGLCKGGKRQERLRAQHRLIDNINRHPWVSARVSIAREQG
eukprot:12581553-Alexandrium_andersonii.AAC.1